MEKLDADGRPLLISVKTDSGHSQQQTDNNARITHKSDNEHSETRITTTTRTTGASGEGGGQQSVRATEGVPAFIDIGQSRVYNNKDKGSSWQHAGSGFYATAWINGDRVSVNIEQKQAAFSGDSRIDAQQLNTRMNGRIGQWMPLGTLSGYHRQRQGGSAGGGRYSTMIYLKVEPLF